MVSEIIWSTGAIDTYNAIIDYLHEEWTEKEIHNFAAKVADKLNIIKTQPK